MAKYHDSDDGKKIDGKVVVFLRPRPAKAPPVDEGKSRASGANLAASAKSRGGAEKGQSKPDALKQGELSNPEWVFASGSGRAIAHGDIAGTRVRAPGLDGRTVRFRVEAQHDGDWQPYATVTAPVSHGVAAASFRFLHSAVKGEKMDPTRLSAGPARLRFFAELT
jgi:hypothetical protein